MRELTPAGAGGVSVLELAGPGAHALAERFTARVLPLAEPALVRLSVAGEFLDDVLVCVRDAEHVEWHLHGSPPLVRRVCALLAESGAVCAPTTDESCAAGSLEERARALVGSAASAAGARMLLDQARGALRTALVALPDLPPEERTRACLELAGRGRAAQFLLRPAVVVLAGPVNAGKSTLFNVLLGRERAITSAEAGTTRDAVRERAQLGEWPVEFVDTAGERDAPADEHGDVERAGQARARHAAARADLVLWLSPPDERALPELPPHARVLGTHADRAARPGAISALADPDGARATVHALVRDALRLPARAWSPGAAVPFDVELARELAELAHEPNASRVRARLAARLARAHAN